MKLTAFNILAICESLAKISEKEFDLNTACLIAGNLNNLSVPRETIDAKRNEIIAKYAQKNKEGEIDYADDGTVKIVDIKKFNDDINNLMLSSVDVELKKIPKKAFEDMNSAPKDILPIINLLEE